MPEHGSFSASDPGFAALGIDDLLAQHLDLVGRIRLCFGIDAESFDRDVVPLIRNYAACTHLLPSTPDNYFRGPGGLLALGLEVAFFSLQGTDAHIFSGRSTISVRRQLEPRWRLATFIGGLCCELHRLLSHLVVVDGAGHEWPAYLMPLCAWLSDRDIRRYYLQWKPNAVETRGLGLVVLPQVVPTALLQYLNDGNTVIVPHLLASIGGVATYRDHNVLDGLVRRSLALVIDRNLRADATRYGTPQFGSHLERYLVDAIRRLGNDDAAWRPNLDKSRVWFGRDGLFLTWPAAASDIVALLESDQLVGIPKSPETILEILSSAGVLEARDVGHATWRIQPPAARMPIDAVKLTSTAILFAGAERPPEPLSDHLACSSEASQPSISGPKRPTTGTQLSLLQTNSPPSAPAEALATSADGPGVSSADPPLQPSPAVHRTYGLKAPLRLNPSVRDALASIVEKFAAADPAAAVCTVARGLFVPLSDFEDQGIQAALAIRALTEVRMLVSTGPDGSHVVAHGADAEAKVGLVIAPSFIDGFDPEAFLPLDPATT